MPIIPASLAYEFGAHFYALKLAASSDPSDFRFGGKPPRGVRPTKSSPFTAFLLALPFSSDRSCSVFINVTSLDSSSPYFVFSRAGEIHGEELGLIEIQWHDRSVEIEEVDLPYRLPSLTFEIGKEGSDPLVRDGMLPDPEHCFDHHKLGGFPYYYQPSDAVIEASQSLINTGFRHVLQLAFPGPEDAEINCNWPFGEYVFHVFARPIEAKRSEWEIRVVWS